MAVNKTLKKVSSLAKTPAKTVQRSPVHPGVRQVESIAAALKEVSNLRAKQAAADKVSRTVAPNLPGKGPLGPSRQVAKVLVKKKTGKFWYERTYEDRPANLTVRPRHF